MLIKVHKDKIKFKKENKKIQKGSKYYEQIEKSIKKHGIINPLICIQDGDIYKICLGMKRFIIGCDLGIQEFEIKVIPNENKKLLLEENLKYKSTDADNAYYTFMKKNL